MGAAAILIPGLGLGILAAKLAKGSMDAVDNLRYEPRGVKLKFKATGLQVNLKLALINTRNTPLFFDSLTAKALWNTSSIGTINYNERTLIPGNGEAVADLPIFIPLAGFLGLVSAAFKAWKDQKLQGRVLLDGTVKAGALSFAFSETYDLGKKGGANA